MDWLNYMGGGLAGFFLWLALDLWLCSVLLAVIPACVVEDLGLLASLRRGLELTRGHRGRIFLILAGFFCLFDLPAYLLFWGLSIFLFDGIFLPGFDGHPATPAQFRIYLISLLSHSFYQR